MIAHYKPPHEADWKNRFTGLSMSARGRNVRTESDRLKFLMDNHVRLGGQHHRFTENINQAVHADLSSTYALML